MAGAKSKQRKQDKKSPVEAESVRRKPTWKGLKHFTPRELTCKCDGLCDHPVVFSIETAAKLDAIRESIGRPVIITSGTRCERHNRKVGGKPLSAHTPKRGVSYAADVKCPDSSFRYAFLKAALPLFNRIGVAKDFIHVDDDPELPGNVMWVY